MFQHPCTNLRLALLALTGISVNLAAGQIARAEGPKEWVRLDHKDSVRAVRFVKDGATLASVGNNGTVRFWDAKTGVERDSWKGYADRVHSVAFSPDGRVMAAGIDGGRVKLWDVATRRERAAGVGAAGEKDHQRVVYALAFSPDGKTLATGGWDESLRLWDVESGKPLAEMAAADAVLSLAFSPDGDTLAVGTAGRAIQLWDVPGRKERLTLRTKAYRVVALAFSADGKALLSGNANDLGHHEELGPGEVQVWDVAGGKPSLTRDSPQQIAAAVLSPDGKRLATGGEGGTIRLWDATSGKVLAVLNGHEGNARCLTFSPDGTALVSGGSDGAVKLWDVERTVGR